MHARADEIVATARSYEGVRWKHTGRTRVGLDCAGLIVRCANDLSLSNFDFIGYGRRPNVKEFTKAMIDGGCYRIPHKDLAHGDVLRFAIEGWPVHVGIYEVDERGHKWAIHAYLPHKQVTRERLRPELEQTISTVWRFPG